MKGSVIALGTLKGLRAAALIRDGKLDDFVVEAGENASPAPGSIFRAKGGRLIKGMAEPYLTCQTGRALICAAPKASNLAHRCSCRSHISRKTAKPSP